MRGVAWGEGRFAEVSSREKEEERDPSVGASGRDRRFGAVYRREPQRSIPFRLSKAFGSSPET